jgi:Double-GTPase 2
VTFGEFVLVVFVILMGLLLAVPATILIGLYYAGKTIVGYLVVLAEALGLRSDKAVPVPVPPSARTADGAEPAYPQYLFGPAVRDLRGALSAGAVAVRERLEADYDRLMEEWMRGKALSPSPLDGSSASAPLRREQLTPQNFWQRVVGILLIFGLGVGTLAGVVAIALFTLVQLVLLGALFTVAGAGILILRAVDSALLQVRGIRIICPTCGKHVPYPSYACGECHTLHRDVRPGRYGVIRRACACGKYRMPTLLLLGSHRMDAYCSNEGCERPLGGGTGTRPESALPFSGDRSAGKTRLMAAMLMTLTDPSAQPSMHFTDEPSHPEPGTPESVLRRRFSELRRALENDQPTRQTAPGQQVAFSLRGPDKSGLAVIHLFDTAGERFLDSERIRELLYMVESRTFLFVLDPLSIPRLWGALKTEERDRLAPMRAKAEPQFVFDQMLDNLRRMGVESRGARLAVAVTKSDVVAGTSVAAQMPPPDNESIISWLEDLEMDNLVRSVQKHFGQFRFFLTSSRLQDGEVGRQVADLTRWVVAPSGLRLRLPSRRARAA